MRTGFSPAQLADPEIADANAILRSCVHCGFCTATCPTYVLLGDELDSPRGRIYLIKQMLEKGEPATAETAKHIDRCLSCLACMTTCPSGVNYMHLIDQARAHVERTYTRPLSERALRALLAFVMPRPLLFRLSLLAARLGKPFATLFGARLAAMLNLVPAAIPRPERFGAPGAYPAQGKKRGRVALLQGCVQSVLDPAINAAAIRLLTRFGYEVVVTGGEPCCGSITLHMGKKEDALARARRSIDQWIAADVDHVLITASGCGTTVKDYGHLLRLDRDYAGKAHVIGAKALDITEFLARLGLPAANKKLKVAYHSACSMQHGQKIHAEPADLLKRAGFTVLDVPEAHLCCGSAGTYNILQPEIAARLKARKAENIASTAPQAVAAGNIGCIAQLQDAMAVPVLHTVQLLDWAHGGPRPQAIPEELDEQEN